MNTHVENLDNEILSYFETKLESGSKLITLPTTDMPDLKFNGYLIAQVKSKINEIGAQDIYSLYFTSDKEFICHQLYRFSKKGREHIFWTSCKTIRDISRFFKYSELSKKLYKKFNLFAKDFSF